MGEEDSDGCTGCFPWLILLCILGLLIAKLAINTVNARAWYDDGCRARRCYHVALPLVVMGDTQDYCLAIGCRK